MLDVPVDLHVESVCEVIGQAEVLAIFFPWLGRSLILDTRHSGRTPAAVWTDQMVGSVAARLRAIRRARPELPWLDELTAIPWLGVTGSFLDTGAYDQLVRRCYRIDHGWLEADCRRALVDLQAAERQLKRAYVAGVNCRTLYRRSVR